MDTQDPNVRQLLEIYKKGDLYFKELLDKAIKNQRLDISEEAAFYLLGILLMGMNKHPVGEKTIAEQFIKAASNSEAKLVGDTSLIIAGIWWQSLFRKLVDVDYYINIGSRSYQKASESSPENLNELFEELSQNFCNLVNVLAEATRCISESNLSNANILRMYEVWLRTHNAFLEQKLRSLGIDVVPGKTTTQ